MLKNNHAFCFIPIVFALVLSACAPQYDWREVRGTSVPFVVVLPAKPTTFSQAVNLADQQVTMTMTAAEVDGVMFAVGTAVMPNAEQAQRALRSMQTALVNNIGGTIQTEKASASAGQATHIGSIEIDAIGPPSANSGGQRVRLVARFVAKDRQVYQVVMIGREKAVTRDAIDTFFTSFKPN